MLDLFFPRRCLGCGRQGQYFCKTCLQAIKPPKTPVCPYCFKRSLLGSAHISCLGPLGLDGLMVISHYQGIIRQAIKKLKYKFVTDLAEELVSLMIQVARGNQKRFFPQFDSSWVLMPVPLHQQRERWRGFNQAEVLGELIALKMDWNYNDRLLIRHKHTQPQAEIKDKKDRWVNIRGAFRAKPDSSFKIDNSKIILFDDVWTSGSTIKACGHVLKRKKAAKVWALTLAR